MCQKLLFVHMRNSSLLIFRYSLDNFLWAYFRIIAYLSQLVLFKIENPVVRIFKPTFFTLMLNETLHYLFLTWHVDHAASTNVSHFLVREVKRMHILEKKRPGFPSLSLMTFGISLSETQKCTSRGNNPLKSELEIIIPW